MAWVGTYGEERPDTIRVEAAALDGRPVFFRVLGPWQQPESAATLAGQRFANIFREVPLVTLLVAAGLVAWRNLRMGRGDHKAARRVAAMLFAVSVASWALVASHVPTSWELYLLSMGLSWAAFQAGVVGLLYLAVEPFVRNMAGRIDLLARIVGGRFRDRWSLRTFSWGSRRDWWFRCSTRRPFGRRTTSRFLEHRREYERERRAISLRHPSDRA